jgi:hypothetical protein
MILYVYLHVNVATVASWIRNSSVLYSYAGEMSTEPVSRAIMFSCKRNINK